MAIERATAEGVSLDAVDPGTPGSFTADQQAARRRSLGRS